MNKFKYFSFMSGGASSLLASMLDKSSFNKDLDPVENCGVYKEIGCAHVDGLGCKMTTCSILKNWIEDEPVRGSMG